MNEVIHRKTKSMFVPALSGFKDNSNLNWKMFVCVISQKSVKMINKTETDLKPKVGLRYLFLVN